MSKEFFGRVDSNGNVQVFHSSGEAATRIDANVYPVGSDLSARYEHPDGIVLTSEDAKRLGIEIDA